MKIELVYRDLYEHCGQVLIDEFANKYDYTILSLSDLLRSNMANKTPLGIQVQTFLEKGEFVPDQLSFEILKQKIETIDSNKLLLINYPRNKAQIELFMNFCRNGNYKLIRAWHLVALNVLENLENHPKYSKMAKKYESHETIKYRSERCHRENNDSIKEIKKHCEIISFESESYGNNFAIDKQRIKRIE